MIVNHLERLLAERGVSIADLHRRMELGSTARLTYSNLHAHVKGKSSRINFATLDAICSALGVAVGDILEHRPD